MAHTFREEAFSFFTHLAGALIAVVGLVLLVMRAQGLPATIGAAIYGATLIAMFLSSTLHHALPSYDGPFRKIDMTAIYLFIAGTYTPFALLGAPPGWGLPILVAVWAFAAVGITLRWALPKTPRWVTVTLYLGMGWMALVAIVPNLELFTPLTLGLLAGGGLVYTIGAIIYARKWPNPWPEHVGYHGLWHLFVLVAAALHFALVWDIVGKAATFGP